MTFLTSNDEGRGAFSVSQSLLLLSTTSLLAGSPNTLDLLQGNDVPICILKFALEWTWCAPRAVFQPLAINNVLLIGTDPSTVPESSKLSTLSQQCTLEHRSYTKRKSRRGNSDHPVSIHTTF